MTKYPNSVDIIVTAMHIIATRHKITYWKGIKIPKTASSIPITSPKMGKSLGASSFFGIRLMQKNSKKIKAQSRLRRNWKKKSQS